LTFADKQDYARIAQRDVLELNVKYLKESLSMENVTKGVRVRVELSLSDCEKGVIKAGGKLAAIKAKQVKK
jgi:hypothetical protein